MNKLTYNQTFQNITVEKIFERFNEYSIIPNCDVIIDSDSNIVLNFENNIISDDIIKIDLAMIGLGCHRI
jgi:uncharacterized protein (DUF4213/DUF364 family)